MNTTTQGDKKPPKARHLRVVSDNGSKRSRKNNPVKRPVIKSAPVPRREDLDRTPPISAREIFEENKDKIAPMPSEHRSWGQKSHVGSGAFAKTPKPSKTEQGQNVTALFSGRSKPSELMPEEDQTDTAILKRHNPSALPKVDLDVSDDPEVLRAQRLVEEAQKELERVTRRQLLKQLVEGSHDLDPSKVNEYCEQEPWKLGNLLDLERSYFGFVPEKFEIKALEYPDGSQEREDFMRARDIARRIYWIQLKKDLFRMSSAVVGRAGTDARGQRAGLEKISEELWHFYKREKFEGNPVWKYQGARVLWAALNVRTILDRMKDNTEFSHVMGLKDVTPQQKLIR